LKALEDVSTKLDAIGKELKKGDTTNISQREELVSKLKTEFIRLRKHVEENFS
jgi:hypothetical protein